METLALFAALQAVWSDIHPVCDQIVQRGTDALAKGGPGMDGRVACARHVASYTLGQAIAAAAVTRGLGYRVPLGPALTGHAINAVLHYAIDRRTGFDRVLRSRLVNKAGYLDHATVERRPGHVDRTGPGTAHFGLDLLCTTAGPVDPGSTSPAAGSGREAD